MPCVLHGRIFYTRNYANDLPFSDIFNALNLKPCIYIESIYSFVQFLANYLFPSFLNRAIGFELRHENRQTRPTRFLYLGLLLQPHYLDPNVFSMFSAISYYYIWNRLTSIHPFCQHISHKAAHWSMVHILELCCVVVIVIKVPQIARVMQLVRDTAWYI